MMMSRSMKLLEYIHATLIFTMMIPFLYAIAAFSDPSGPVIFYIKCLLVAVPVVVTDRAAKLVRGLTVYIVICIVMMAGLSGITGFLPHALSQKNFAAYELCYSGGILTEAFSLSVMRFRDRLNASERRKAEDPFAPEQTGFLNSPATSFVWYFAVMYLIGICFNSKVLCDMAFWNAVIYTFVSLAYAYLGATRAYLNLNRRTGGIPRKRLYAVSAAMLLIFAALLLAGMLPAVLLADCRQYTDVREWFDAVKPVPYEFNSESYFRAPATGGVGDMMLLFEDARQVREPSRFANAVLWVLGTACVFVFAYAVIQAVRQLLKDFRNSLDENGDLVEEIENDQTSAMEEFVNLRRRHGVESEAERIRRRYRKVIRKHRKDRPAPYESPAEIEENAGLKDDEPMRLLHREYESVRYHNPFYKN